MRPGLVLLGLLSPLACTLPNPAYHVTDSSFEGSSSGSTAGTGSASNSSSASTSNGPTTASTGMTATSDQPTSSSGPTSQSTGTTNPGDDTETDATITATSTTSPMTSTTDVTASTSTTGPDSTSTSLSTSTTGPDSTSTTSQPFDLANMDVCPLIAGPTLALSVQHVPAPVTCNAPLGPLFHGVYKGKADADSLIFRECMNFNECKAKNGSCIEKQTVTINVAGPTTHVPVFEPNECVNISYLGTGYADANTCNTKLVRLARLANGIATTSVFVGAVGVPDTNLLPDPWPDALEFAVAPALIEQCGPATVCGQLLGDYQLVGDFDGMTVMVPHKTEKPASVPLFDVQNNKVGVIPGTFYNLRSWSQPDDCDFKWLWLADDNKPG